MRRFLLGLVVFVLYFIQAQVDSKQTSKIEYHKSIETVLNQFNAEDKPKWERLFKLAFEQGYTTGHATGFWRGNATGHSEGYALAEGKGFLKTFLCATNGLKALLERGYQYNTLCDGQYNYPDIPFEYKLVILQKDQWVMQFGDQKKKETIEPDMRSTLYKMTNSMEAMIMDTLKTPPVNEGDYLRTIRTSFKNWYKIVKYELKTGEQISFIDQLQSLLKEFMEKNAGAYKSIDDVHVRFAAHMARSYAMTCALHHQLGNYMDRYTAQHTDMSFSEILFKFAPTWHMSQEQFEFLNILRQTLPGRMKSLKHIFFKHHGEWEIFPYDDSDDCGGLKIHELPTPPVHMTTFASVVATTTVTTTTANPPIS